MESIDEIIAKHDPWNDPFGYNKQQVKETVIDALNQMIDYISDNIETDYTYHGHKAGEIDLANNLEVYCVKGQFDKIKKLIK